MKNCSNSRLKDGNESIDLILLEREFHCFTREKANAEGQFDKDLEIWKSETLPRVGCEWMSEMDAISFRKYCGPRPCFILKR